jgi:hypothetical protein
MKRVEFKSVASDFLKGMLEKWFPDKPFIKGLGLSLIDANIHKYDTLLELFEDQNGDIDVKGIIENMGSPNEPFKIELGKYSPMLPNRTLLITKEDLNELLEDVNRREKRTI